MPPEQSRPPVFRFAPSPNGHLHVGHAYSAIVNHNRARECGGRFLLRIEDIDLGRYRPEFLDQILDDLAWLGLSWDGPVRRQSEHFDDYRAALRRLAARVPLYPAAMSRLEIRDFVLAWEMEQKTPWPRDPDGAPHYPALDRPARFLQPAEIDGISGVAVRVAMDRALACVGGGLCWQETGSGPGGETGTVPADLAAWGDVVVARKDCPASYPLAVVVDDAIQGVSHVVRGQDLFWATSVQRLLQHALGLPAPVYHHHRLILDADGRKLSKSRGSLSIKAVREAGRSRDEVLATIGVRPLGV